MVNSMTGFGSKEKEILPWGKVSVELRSTNHKFLEIVLHLPDGFLSLEDKIKKEIERKIKRGRITCAVNVADNGSRGVVINKKLLRAYLTQLKEMQRQFHIQETIGMDTLLHLPGVLSMSTSRFSPQSVWPGLKLLVGEALGNLVRMRQKEGTALKVYLQAQNRTLRNMLALVKSAFRRAVKEKLGRIKTDEERTSFLKESDITEEIDRLAFHLKNFASKFSRTQPVGKELDFIAQEMQREANTMGAKSCDAAVSALVVQLKSQIEKTREQLQNIE